MLAEYKILLGDISSKRTMSVRADAWIANLLLLRAAIELKPLQKLDKNKKLQQNIIWIAKLIQHIVYKFLHLSYNEIKNDAKNYILITEIYATETRMVFTHFKFLETLFLISCNIHDDISLRISVLKTVLFVLSSILKLNNPSNINLSCVVAAKRWVLFLALIVIEFFVIRLGEERIIKGLEKIIIETLDVQVPNHQFIVTVLNVFPFKFTRKSYHSSRELQVSDYGNIVLGLVPNLIKLKLFQDTTPLVRKKLCSVISEISYETVKTILFRNHLPVSVVRLPDRRSKLIKAVKSLKDSGTTCISEFNANIPSDNSHPRHNIFLLWNEIMKKTLVECNGVIKTFQRTNSPQKLLLEHICDLILPYSQLVSLHSNLEVKCCNTIVFSHLNHGNDITSTNLIVANTMFSIIDKNTHLCEFTREVFQKTTSCEINSLLLIFYLICCPKMGYYNLTHMAFRFLKYSVHPNSVFLAEIIANPDFNLLPIFLNHLKYIEKRTRIYSVTIGFMSFMNHLFNLALSQLTKFPVFQSTIYLTQPKNIVSFMNFIRQLLELVNNEDLRHIAHKWKIINECYSFMHLYLSEHLNIDGSSSNNISLHLPKEFHCILMLIRLMPKVYRIGPGGLMQIRRTSYWGSDLELCLLTECRLIDILLRLYLTCKKLGRNFVPISLIENVLDNQRKIRYIFAFAGYTYKSDIQDISSKLTYLLFQLFSTCKIVLNTQSLVFPYKLGYIISFRESLLKPLFFEKNTEYKSIKIKNQSFSHGRAAILIETMLLTIDRPTPNLAQILLDLDLLFAPNEENYHSMSGGIPNCLCTMLDFIASASQNHSWNKLNTLERCFCLISKILINQKLRKTSCSALSQLVLSAIFTEKMKPQKSLHVRLVAWSVKFVIEGNLKSRLFSVYLSKFFRVYRKKLSESQAFDVSLNLKV
eukprot:gnl/MRDRNA2_/MRDRNA2_86658_c0_seq1.p1 gnl/MRDRNA2_/MRDRNA2_86658_c0~~gnl/MRDRNA2_/MRDRNA2_86658_c0_seq1.p1  ORF type:complete len:1043 (-),score=-91.05 gnl/MRDRNA2_/MRDRNA2_86658_c0_seq1:446-3223(-)